MALTPGAVTALYYKQQDSNSLKPILQVLDIKKLEAKQPAADGKPQQLRYRLVVSDGEHFCQAILSTALSEKIADMPTNSLFKLTEYNINEVGGRVVCIIVALEVVNNSVDGKIGNPSNIETSAKTAMSDAPTPIASASGAPRDAKSNFASPPPARTATGTAAGGATRSASSYASPSQSSSAANVRPINALNLYQKNWAIKARVTSKGKIRTWSKGSGGTLFSVDLVDSAGGQIRATMFNSAAAKFDPVFEEKGVYIISRGQLKTANKKFNQLPNDFEITLNDDAEVTRVDDDAGIKSQHFDFITIDQLNQIEQNSFIDIAGVVTKIGDVTQINSKAGKSLTKRTITLADQSNRSVDITLWDKEASDFDTSIASGTVVVMKSVRVSDFGGKSLSTSFQSKIVINPTDVEEAAALASWWDSTGKDGKMESVSDKRNGGGAGGAGGAFETPRKFFSSIKDEFLGTQSSHMKRARDANPAIQQKWTGDYFNVRGTIVYYRADEKKAPWYLACSNKTGDKLCQKKVIEQNGGWYCNGCNKTSANPEARYILSLLACDHTGGTWLTAFNEQAISLIGRPASELAKLLPSNVDAFKAAFSEKNFGMYTFKLRAQEEKAAAGQNEGEMTVRVHILSAKPVAFKEENAVMIKALEAHFAKTGEQI